MYICMSGTHVDMLQILKQNHSWLGNRVLVSEYTVSMDALMSGSLHTLSSTIPSKKVIVQSAFIIEVSKPFAICLKKNQEKLEKQLGKIHALILIDTEVEQVTITPCSGSEELKDWQASCQTVIDSFLKV